MRQEVLGEARVVDREERRERVKGQEERVAAEDLSKQTSS